MSKINAFLHVLNQKGKTRLFMDFQFMDNLNMTAWWKKTENPEKVTACRKSLTNFIT